MTNPNPSPSDEILGGLPEVNDPSQVFLFAWKDRDGKTWAGMVTSPDANMPPPDIGVHGTLPRVHRFTDVLASLDELDALACSHRDLAAVMVGATANPAKGGE